jgi:hypothetical protein
MATAEQKTASRQIMDAVTALNAALGRAGSVGLFVELRLIPRSSGRNGQYQVATIETRETVLP